MARHQEERYELVGYGHRGQDYDHSSADVSPEVIRPAQDQQRGHAHGKQVHRRAVQGGNRDPNTLPVDGDTPSLARTKQLPGAHGSQAAHQQPQIRGHRPGHQKGGQNDQPYKCDQDGSEIHTLPRVRLRPTNMFSPRSGAP